MSPIHEHKPAEKKNPFKNEGMFKCADPMVFELARDRRKNMTDAETLLWVHLRSGVNGFKIRRQHPIGIYIVDFYCHRVKLIVEVDGLIHNSPEIKIYDKRRETELKLLGYCILRFSNHEIFTDIENVLEKIKINVEELFQSSIINQKTKSPL